jgi:type I restriction enzyme S subunit
MIKINKNSWSDANIEQIVDEVNDRVENPSQSKYQKFVGLEDFESGQFKIKKWGSTENLVSAMKLFKKGDLLFARRNAYLKRASEVDFDGICSGDAIVLREKSKIEKGLLTFILNTDRFWEYAIANAAGTMSKRVKWRDLAKYKFLLPTIEEQKQIAALFQNIESSLEQVEAQQNNLKTLWKRLIDDFVSDSPSFGNLLKGKKFKTFNYCDVTEKLMRRIDPLNYDIDRIVAGENLESEDFKIRTWQKIGEGYLGPAFHVLFKTGDILYGSRRTYLRKVSCAEFDGVCANTTYVIRSKEEFLMQDLLKHIMLSERFTQYSIGVSKGSTNPYINWKDLDNFSFQLPDLKTQKEIVVVLDDILAIVEQLKQQKATLMKLKKKLLNEILG